MMFCYNKMLVVNSGRMNCIAAAECFIDSPVDVMEILIADNSGSPLPVWALLVAIHTAHQCDFGVVC